MKKILELITEEFEKAFEKAGYDKKLGKVGYQTDRTFVSTSVTVQWQEKNYIIKHQ